MLCERQVRAIFRAGVRSGGAARPRSRRGPLGRRALAAGPPRRRHDPARQAALDGRSRAPSTGSPRGSPAARCSCRRRTGRRRRRRWSPRSSAATARLQPLGREPALGRRLHPPLVAAAPSSGCSRSTRRRCPRSRAASVRASSRSGTSSATSSTATASSSTSPRGGARPSRISPTRCSSSTPTTRSSASSRADASGTVTYGIDDPRHARDVAPACRRLDVLLRLRHAVRVRRRVRRPPR